MATTSQHGWVLPNEYDNPWMPVMNQAFDAIDAATVVSVTDYMTAAQRADVLSGATTLDVTGPLQAAATAIQSRGGGVLGFPPAPAACMINQSIILGSQTMVFGRGCRIHANPSYVGTTGGGPATATYTSPFFRNLNNGAGAVTDHDIVIRDLNFDWGTASAITALGSSAYSVYMRMVDRLEVSGCRQITGGAGVVNMRAGRETFVFNCVSAGCTWADYWFDEAFSDGRIIGCVSRSGSRTAAVWLTNTSGATSTQAGGCFIAGCEVYGARGAGDPGGCAIRIDGGGAGKPIYQCRSIGNFAFDCDALVYMGGGSGGYHLSQNDMAWNCGGRTVWIDSGMQACQVNSLLIVTQTGTSTNPVVWVNGTYNVVRGLIVQGGSGSNWVGWLMPASSNCLFEMLSSTYTPTTGRVIDQGTGNVVLDTYNVGAVNSGGTGQRMVTVRN
jgi:hypothetical protein